MVIWIRKLVYDGDKVRYPEIAKIEDWNNHKCFNKFAEYWIDNLMTDSPDEEYRIYVMENHKKKCNSPIHMLSCDSPDYLQFGQFLV